MSREQPGASLPEEDVALTEQPLGECSCKVGRSASAYDVDSIDAELVDRWVGTESDSLRDLETYVNTELVRGALQSAGHTVIEGEAANYYRLLTDDSTSEGNRTQAKRRLQRDGVDPEALLDSFVSHQTIHTHLRDCLDVTYDGSVDDEQRIENAQTFIQGLQSRTERITEGTLEQLRDAGIQDLAEFSVFVDLMVSCDECGRVMSIQDTFEHGGCVCQKDS
jgi:hypothetical protein